MSRNAIRWAKIARAGTDAEQFHVQQLEYLERVGTAIIVEPFGFHANCAADSLALIFSVQGNAENRAAIAWSPKNRPKMLEGEVSVYHPETNSLICWRSGGNLEITTDANVTATIGGNVTANVGGNIAVTADGNINADAGGNLSASAGGNAEITVSGDLSATVSGDVNVDAANINLTGNLTVNGNIEVNGSMTNNGKNVGDTHQHMQANDSFGNAEAIIVGVL